MRRNALDTEAGVSREDVKWCFASILGRQLDDEAAIEHFLKSEPSFRSLVTTITSSLEFQQIIRNRS
jgi:hypothetical protein